MEKGSQKSKELQRIRSCPAYKVLLREREALRAAGSSGATTTSRIQGTDVQAQADDSAPIPHGEPAPSTTPTLQRIRSCPAYKVLLREREALRAAGSSGASGSTSTSHMQGMDVQAAADARAPISHGEPALSTTPTLQQIRNCPAYKIILSEREALRSAARRGALGSTSTSHQQDISRSISLPECIAPTDIHAEARAPISPIPSTVQPLVSSSCQSTREHIANCTTRTTLDRSGDIYSVAELQQMDADLAFVVPSADDLAVIQRAAIEAMTDASSEVKPCCVCELDWPISAIHSKKVTDQLVEAMERCLRVALPPELPAFLTTQYDASTKDVRLKGLLLLPSAIYSKDGVIKADICVDCDGHLSRHAKTPPRDAIANGNFIGHLPPAFRILTRTDEQAIALMLPCVSLSVVTGGPCRTIKSHHYIVRNTEGPIVDMLPRDLTQRVRVTIVGSMTPAQTAACKKRYDVNIPMCKKMLHFLDKNNREYRRRQRGANEPHADTTRTSVIVDRSTSPEQATNEDDVVDSIRDEGTYSSFGSSVIEDNGDHSLESTCIGASSLIVQAQQQNFVDVLVRTSNDYVPMAKWAICVKLFPTLFPGGYGGPTEPRAKNISVRKWILRCLKIHGHAFEKHYAFMLLAFDFLASQNARETLYLKMNVKRQALKAAEVKRSTVVQAVKYFNYLSECRARGIKPRPPVIEVQRVIDLRKGLRAPESAFYGSNIGRMRARHDLFGMLKRFGPLQIFFTISPDSAGTYNIAVKAGLLSKQTIDDANILLTPSRADRKAIAASHPVECARYFLRVVNTVIDVVLGWDQRAHAPRRGGGIFGVVRCFGAAAETQLAGDLHVHFAIWLHGFPNTSSGFADAISGDTGFYDRLVMLVNTVLTTKPPCLNQDTRCIHCGEDGVLKSIVPGVDAFRRPAPGASAPAMSICEACGTSYKASEILDESIEALASLQHVHMSSQFRDLEKCRPAQVGVEKSLASSLLVRDLQVHYWNHCRSCFKKTIRTPRGTVCRFLKPESVHLGPTTIQDGHKLLLHRPIGCEYVNPYNRVIMDTFKANHDAQFVLSTGSKDTAAYVLKYCFKHQNPIENQAALSIAAFAKAASKTNALPVDTPLMERGYRILGSMLYAVTNGQEVAAPMAALYILNESPFWFSHEFVRVNLKAMLRKHTDSVEVNISQQSGKGELPPAINVSSETSLEKYWKREGAMEDVAFIDVVEQYECTGIQKSVTDTSSLSYRPLGYSRLASAKVLVICGDELPDITRSLNREQIDFYYTALLTLFKPHRENTLVHPNESPVSAYHSFVALGDGDQSRRMLQYHEQCKDYYCAQRNDTGKTESAEENLLRTRAPPATAWTPMDGVGGMTRDTDDNFDDPLPHDFLDLAAVTAIDTSTAKLSQDATNTVQNISLLQSTLNLTSDEYDIAERVTLGDGFCSGSYTSQIISAGSIGDSDAYEGTQRFISQFRDARTRLERLHECFAPVPFRLVGAPARWTQTTLPEFPQIAMTSEAFQLNFWQHVMFEMAARHLLYSYSQDIADALPESTFPGDFARNSYEIKPQLLGYLGGEAGTGKSTVVDALLVFARLWGREGSVETMAFTGVAAINIKGKTMHSARNLKLNGAESNSAPTIEMKQKFRRVVLCIIDEISITDQSLLGGTDAVSRSMTMTPERIMGGKHALLIGDLLQLPPIAGSPCFKVPPTSANRLRHAGYALYEGINFVVFLTKNMRARFDPEYTQILDDLRWGRLSDAQMERLNTRVQTQVALEADIPRERDSFYRPVVVCTNQLRCAINFSMVFGIARDRELPVYESLAVPCARSQHIVERLANVNDNLTDRIPMKLLFFIGMPVMITRKHPSLLAADVIANGVIGTVVGTHPPLENLATIAYEAAGVVIHKRIHLPELLLIKLLNCETTLVNSFPVGVIGLPPMHISVRLTQIPNLSQASVTVDQFAIVPAFACTTEKLQGKTCHDGVVVTPLDRRKTGVPFQTLYVALSRAVGLAGLTLTEPITREYLAKFKPTPAIVNEMRRLIDLVESPPYISAPETDRFNQWKARQHP